MGHDAGCKTKSGLSVQVVPTTAGPPIEHSFCEFGFLSICLVRTQETAGVRASVLVFRWLDQLRFSLRGAGGRRPNPWHKSGKLKTIKPSDFGGWWEASSALRICLANRARVGRLFAVQHAACAVKRCGRRLSTNRERWTNSHQDECV